MSLLRPTFEEAKNFSSYVGLVVNMALCQGLAVILVGEGGNNDTLLLRWSYFVAAASFAVFSGYLAIAISEVTYRFLSKRIRSDRGTIVRGMTAAIVGIVASAIYLSVWIGAVELSRSATGTG